MIKLLGKTSPSRVKVTPRPIRTMLTLDVMRNGRIVERRQGWSKSFTMGFIQLLYTQLAYIPYGSPYSVNGLFGPVGLAVSGMSFDNLLLANGGGDARVNMINASSSYASGIGDTLRGHVLGILVGADNTPVTPLDTRPKQVFHHGKGAALGAGVIDSFYPADNSSSTGYWGASTLLAPIYTTTAAVYPVRGFRATSGRMKLFRTGSPGTCLMELMINDKSIQQVLASGTFDGNALGVGAGAATLAGATFNTPVDLYPDYAYYLRVTAPNGNSSNYIQERYLANGTSPARYTDQSGANLSVWDISGLALPELSYEGCAVNNLTVSGGTVTFNISRLIRNLSGASVTIQEVTMQAVGEWYFNPPLRLHPVLIARDIVSPALTLNNNETLLATYTPSITV